MNRYVCIHGHFYQPPRENPWLEEIELEDSAYPYHDWNERVSAECYEPNTASRILGHDGRIVDIVNNYSKMSFDFGPTLLSWMERKRPGVYRLIVEADQASKDRFSGHGGAIGQPYNHMIMPLANSRDKRTQVIWGIKDFEHRFGRTPEGMWLPETAVDFETLEALAEHGMKFTILGPHQVRPVGRPGESESREMSRGRVDPRMPYTLRLPSERRIAVFLYDDPVSNEISFGRLLGSGGAFAQRLLELFSPGRGEDEIVHVATDGETFGHHFRFGDMALAYCLHYLESKGLAKITVYGEHLERRAPVHEVDVLENSSWSCPHGVERWRSDCGCKTGPHPEWHQEWRGPLREALDWLKDTLAPVYEREVAAYLKDPWQARDEYISVILDRSRANVARYLSEHAVRQLSKEDEAKVLKLLEMQRHLMLMYSSCGWFFEDISGIETVQIMCSASRAMQLAREVASVDLEPDYLERIEAAPGNTSQFNSGADVYQMLVKPVTVDLPKVAAHYALSSLFEEYPETTRVFCYTARRETYDLTEAGLQRLAVGRANIHSDLTWEESTVGFAVLSLGDHNLIGGAREWGKDELFSLMHREVRAAFLKSDIPQVLELINKHFSTHGYSLRHLFKDKQRQVLNRVFDSALREIEAAFRQIVERHYPIMQVMREMRIPLPKALATSLEFILNTDLRRLLTEDELDLDELRRLTEEVKRWSVQAERPALGFAASQTITGLVRQLSQSPEDLGILGRVEAVVGALKALALDLNLWECQNTYFAIGRRFQDNMRERAESGDGKAKRWIEHFSRLGDYLQVRIS